MGKTREPVFCILRTGKLETVLLRDAMVNKKCTGIPIEMLTVIALSTIHAVGALSLQY